MIDRSRRALLSSVVQLFRPLIATLDVQTYLFSAARQSVPNFSPTVQQCLNLFRPSPDCTSRGPEQKTRRHYQEWKRIIPAPPRELSLSSKRLPPRSERQSAS